MNFSDFYNFTGKKSDKGTIHTYIDNWYNAEFTPIRDKNLNILEIGINKGDSIILWRDWFFNSSIYGIDNGSEMSTSNYDTVNSIKNVNILYGDAYSDDVVKQYDDNMFDYIIDDGPHSIESQIKCVQKWFSKLKVGGKLIIEDIMDVHIRKIEFDKLNLPYEIIDLRSRNNPQKDEVMFIFKK